MLLKVNIIKYKEVMIFKSRESEDEFRENLIELIDDRELYSVNRR